MSKTRLYLDQNWKFLLKISYHPLSPRTSGVLPSASHLQLEMQTLIHLVYIRCARLC